MGDFDLSNYSLAERQMYFFNGHRCPYCFGDTDLVDSIEVYQKSYSLIYICRPCKAWVNTHNNSDQAFGTLAKKPLRDLRHTAHGWFDPLWQKRKEIDGSSTKTARAKAYRWMAELLGISREESHIGYLGIADCEKLIEACKKYYKTNG